jgi:hypothetical protein
VAFTSQPDVRSSRIRSHIARGGCNFSTRRRLLGAGFRCCHVAEDRRRSVALLAARLATPLHSINPSINQTHCGHLRHRPSQGPIGEQEEEEAAEHVAETSHTHVPPKHLGQFDCAPCPIAGQRVVALLDRLDDVLTPSLHRLTSSNMHSEGRPRSLTLHSGMGSRDPKPGERRRKPRYCCGGSSVGGALEESALAVVNCKQHQGWFRTHPTRAGRAAVFASQNRNRVIE